MKPVPIRQASLAILLLALLCGTAGRARAEAPERGQPPAGTGLREGSFSYRDPRLPSGLPARSWRLYLPRSGRGVSGDPYGPPRDPKFNVEYPFHLQVQTVGQERSTGGDEGAGAQSVNRRFVIHFLKQEDETLARYVGALMARFYWITTDYLGRGPAGYINVWLARNGRAGGEEHRGNIYLYAVGEPRAPAEWVRELAHEYGHITLPKMGPFTEPEQWSSGYVGERLYMKWLLADNGLVDVWDRPIDGAAYVANQIAPLRERFLTEGPNTRAAALTNADGMDFFIGEIMAIEAGYGPMFLRRLLDRFATPRPQNLPLYLTTTLKEMVPAQVSLDPSVCIPGRSQMVMPAGAAGPATFRKAAFWLFLPGGQWRIGLEGAAPPALNASLDAAPLRKGMVGAGGALTWDTAISSVSTAWRRLDLSPPAGSTIQIRRLVITRIDPGS